MSSISWSTAWKYSWIGKLLTILLRWWDFSLTSRVIQVITNFLKIVWSNSSVVRYFRTNQTGLSGVFRKSWILNGVTTFLFQVVHKIQCLIHNIFADSWLHKNVQSVQTDLRTNPIRYISSLIFSGLVLWVILTLVVGSGFSKSESMAILFTAFLTWFLSYLETDSFEIIRNSRLIQWFLSWPDSDDHSKGES